MQISEHAENKTTQPNNSVYKKKSKTTNNNTFTKQLWPYWTSNLRITFNLEQVSLGEKTVKMDASEALHITEELKKFV